MDWRKRLLWIDCVGAGIAGVLTLALSRWLSQLYQLPHNLVILIGVVNLAYGTYSYSLARRARRPMPLLQLLAVANMAWLPIMLRWAYLYWGTASPFGLIHLVGEALYVGGLGAVEWRCREDLVDE